MPIYHLSESKHFSYFQICHPIPNWLNQTEAHPNIVKNICGSIPNLY